jgi:hypothetical protein
MAGDFLAAFLWMDTSSASKQIWIRWDNSDGVTDFMMTWRWSFCREISGEDWNGSKM